MSEGFLEPVNRSSMGPPPRATNYEFKFDEIETAVVAK